MPNIFSFFGCFNPVAERRSNTMLSQPTTIISPSTSRSNHLTSYSKSLRVASSDYIEGSEESIVVFQQASDNCFHDSIIEIVALKVSLPSSTIVLRDRDMMDDWDSSTISSKGDFERELEINLCSVEGKGHDFEDDTTELRSTLFAEELNEATNSNNTSSPASIGWAGGSPAPEQFDDQCFMSPSPALI